MINLSKKLSLAVPLIAGALTISGCGPSRNDAVNRGDIKDLTTFLNGNDEVAILYAEHFPRVNIFGEVVSTDGTKLYIRFPDGNNQKFFQTENLVYDIEKGDINGDCVDDFIVKIYTLSLNCLGEELKTGTVNQIYLSVDGRFTYKLGKL